MLSYANESSGRVVLCQGTHPSANHQVHQRKKNGGGGQKEKRNKCRTKRNKIKSGGKIIILQNIKMPFTQKNLDYAMTLQYVEEEVIA